MPVDLIVFISKVFEVQEYKKKSGRAPIPASCIRVCAVVWKCGEGQADTDRQTHRRP